MTEPAETHAQRPSQRELVDGSAMSHRDLGRDEARWSGWAWFGLSIAWFLGLASWIVAQQWLLFPLHDDWGLAVLDYVAVRPEGAGREYGIGSIVMFVRELYFSWTGRVGAMVVLCGTFRIGIDFVRGFQCVVLLAIVLLAASLGAGGRSRALHPADRAVIVLSGAVLLCLPVGVAAGGLYWFTAAAVYAWGVPIVLWAMWIASASAKPSMAEALVLAMAAAFSEPTGAAAVAFAVVRLFGGRIASPRRTPSLVEVAYAALPIGVFLACMVAPGNFKRRSGTEYPDLPFLGLLAKNVSDAGVHLIDGNAAFRLVLAGSAACLVLSAVAGATPLRRGAVYIGTMSLFAIALTGVVPSWVVLLGSLFFVGVCIRSVDNRRRTDGFAVSVFVSVLASLMIVVAISPAVAARSLLTFVLLMTVPVTMAFLQAIRAGGVAKYASIMLLAWVLWEGVINSGRIYAGYLGNYQTHCDNDVRLRKAEIDFRLDREPDIIVEYHRIPNRRFAEAMPYERPLIERWIRKYYRLPESTVFAYRP